MCQAPLASGRWTKLVGELTPVSHLEELEVTSGAAAHHDVDITSLRVGKPRSKTKMPTEFIFNRSNYKVQLKWTKGQGERTGWKRK